MQNQKWASHESITFYPTIHDPYIHEFKASLVCGSQRYMVRPCQIGHEEKRSKKLEMSVFVLFYTYVSNLQCLAPSSWLEFVSVQKVLWH